MPKKMIAMLIVRKLILLLQRGFAQRHAAAELHIGGKSVARYCRRIKQSGKRLEELYALPDVELAALLQPTKQNKEVTPRLAEFMARKDYFFAELTRTGVTRWLLWKEYQKEVTAAFGYSKFCELLSAQKAVREATMILTHNPGEMLMIDFAGTPFEFMDPTSREVISYPVFVAVLPYSGMGYVMALADTTLPQLVKALNNCLHYLGGFP